MFVLWIAGVAAAISAQSADAQTTADRADPAIILSAVEVETGGTLLVEIDCRRTPPAGTPQLFFYDQSIIVFPHPAKGRGVFAGLVGIPLGAPPGKTSVKLEWGSGTPRRVTTATFTVRVGQYGEEVLRVDPRHVRPSPADQERNRREQEELKRIYAAGDRLRLWQAGFVLPLPGEVNGPFGTRRLFNGELQSQHTGVDFRGQAGDPIAAANSGTVRLAKDLFYSGNAVVIDHGAGVFTSYSHLSRIDVRVGQKIGKGDVLGLVGATGRATGPHLHWGVKVNQVTVNPLAFVQAAARLGSQ